MDAFWVAYVTAFALGAGHALEVDHMVAVSAFIGNEPRLGAAIGFGIRWGVGHAVAVLVAGSALAGSGLKVPAGAQNWAELAVGIMLIGVGIWSGRAAARLHVHQPSTHDGHAHLHAHGAPPQPHTHSHPHHAGRVKRHRHLSTIVGAVHGLAGTAPVVALVPVTLMPTPGRAVAYLAAFGVGTTLAMGLYAALTALAVERLAVSLRVVRGVAFATAGSSLAVGLWWISTAALALGW